MGSGKESFTKRKMDRQAGVHQTAFLLSETFLCLLTTSLQSVARRIRMYPRDSTPDSPMFDLLGGAFLFGLQEAISSETGIQTAS